MQHDLVPRFSIHNVFALKEEMDATNWGDILIATAKDWAVPDVIEKSETYKKLTAQGEKQASVSVMSTCTGTAFKASCLSRRAFPDYCCTIFAAMAHPHTLRSQRLPT